MCVTTNERTFRHVKCNQCCSSTFSRKSHDSYRHFLHLASHTHWATMDQPTPHLGKPLYSTNGPWNSNEWLSWTPLVHSPCFLNILCIPYGSFYVEDVTSLCYIMNLCVTYCLFYVIFMYCLFYVSLFSHFQLF